MKRMMESLLENGRMLFCLALLIGCFVWGSSVYAEEADAPETTEAQETGFETGTYNLLLIGVDRRDTSWAGNSDSMVLVTVNDEKRTVFMTSFLRDLYADIPGVGVAKLNASCANGGAELCVETITGNYGVKIDNYAMVDFNQMISVIDILGGVDLELDWDEVVTANSYIQTMCEAVNEPYELHEITEDGYLHLDGFQAVGYARNRFTGGGSDFGRTQRQRKVLMAALDAVRDCDAATMLLLGTQIMANMSSDLTVADITALLTNMENWMGYELQEQHIPYDDSYYSQNEILIPNDMGETIARIRQTLYD